MCRRQAIERVALEVDAADSAAGVSTAATATAAYEAQRIVRVRLLRELTQHLQIGELAAKKLYDIESLAKRLSVDDSALLVVVIVGVVVAFAGVGMLLGRSIIFQVAIHHTRVYCCSVVPCCRLRCRRRMPFDLLLLLLLLLLLKLVYKLPRLFQLQPKLLCFLLRLAVSVLQSRQGLLHLDFAPLFVLYHNSQTHGQLVQSRRSSCVIG